MWQAFNGQAQETDRYSREILEAKSKACPAFSRFLFSRSLSCFFSLFPSCVFFCLICFGRAQGIHKIVSEGAGMGLTMAMMQLLYAFSFWYASQLIADKTVNVNNDKP